MGKPVFLFADLESAALEMERRANHAAGCVAYQRSEIQRAELKGATLAYQDAAYILRHTKLINHKE